MEKFVLFGAGVYAKKYKAILEYLNMDFEYFTDNDSSKWGTVLYEKTVIPVEELSHIQDIRIIISSTHEKAIREQLSQMGLEERIMGLDELYDLCLKKMLCIESSRIKPNGQESIIVDMYEGIGWGGSELWAANLAYGLKNSDWEVVLVGGTEQLKLEDQYESMIARVSEKETISKMVNLIENRLPCIFINNFAGCAFIAAVIVKKRYPDLVKIVSVIHNDNKSLFDAHMMMAGSIDKIFCVSRQICRHMWRLYDFKSDHYYFKEQPIALDSSWEREACQSGALRIGYAARLVVQQKRADMLVDLIELMEKKGIDYIFQIAGEGECSALIETYITENHLENKVRLLGRLAKSQMDLFWKDQDVFVNVSEYEGTSLSMLEAMGYGCVPVVTDVSGVGEFIVNDENGYICKIGDMTAIAERVEKLSLDRERLMIYGRRCREIIQKRCNPEDYIEYWKGTVLGKWE